MIVDSSAVIALLLREPGSARLATTLLGPEPCQIPAPAYVECCLVLGGRFGADGIRRLDDFLQQYRIAVIAFTEAHALVARDAFLRFGKGRNPAGLNFGDCMSYAVARAEGRSLLFVGEDFAQTDVVAA